MEAGTQIFTDTAFYQVDSGVAFGGHASVVNSLSIDASL